VDAADFMSKRSLSFLSSRDGSQVGILGHEKKNPGHDKTKKMDSHPAGV
jgi:hypothetical protein